MVYFRGLPIGTVAAIPQAKHVYSEHHCQLVKPDKDLNYSEIFVRDNVPVMMYCLLDGREDIVENFLNICLELQSDRPDTLGVFPASFYIEQDHITADYGQRAIGRVVSVDSTLWWPILAHSYVNRTSNHSWAENDSVQQAITRVLGLILNPDFREDPTLHVPDGAFMIDRPLDVWGSPLEIQVLLYGALVASARLVVDKSIRLRALERAIKLRRYLRKHYWLTGRIVETLRRRPTEQYGEDIDNEYNIRTETIPHWLQPWLSGDGGYLIGNIRTGRPDFRFFTLGNCLASIFDVISHEQQRSLFRLIIKHRSELVGEMPLRICHPPLDESDWQNKTGYDPKNRPWCYHNAGHWPCLLWFLVVAYLRHQSAFSDTRYGDVYYLIQDLLKQGFLRHSEQLHMQKWAEYFDGPTGVWVGQQSRSYQTWTIAGFLLSQHILIHNPADCSILDLPSIKDLRVSMS